MSQEVSKSPDQWFTFLSGNNVIIFAMVTGLNF